MCTYRTILYSCHHGRRQRDNLVMLCKSKTMGSHAMVFTSVKRRISHSYDMCEPSLWSHGAHRISKDKVVIKRTFQ